MTVVQAQERLILATDLDGTWAHGDAAVRDRVAGWLRSRPGSALVYVTGRSPDAVATLAERLALPEPDVLIADVGTSVVRGFGPDHVVEIETAIARTWPGGDLVRARLADLPELALQDVRAPRRVSYWIEPVRRLRAGSADPFAATAPGDRSLEPEAAALADRVRTEAAVRLGDLDVDVLLSANVYLDVLPRGADKGTTLARVLDWLGASAAGCVVAGDSLNDLALFGGGRRGIVVGNCEPALRSRVAGLAHVYVARAPGVAGVAEGLRHHGLAPDLSAGGSDGE